MSVWGNLDPLYDNSITNQKPSSFNSSSFQPIPEIHISLNRCSPGKRRCSFEVSVSPITQAGQQEDKSSKLLPFIRADRQPSFESSIQKFKISRISKDFSESSESQDSNSDPANDPQSFLRSNSANKFSVNILPCLTPVPKESVTNDLIQF